MKSLIKIGLIIILVDAIAAALPAAYSLSQADQYLPQHERGALANFFGALGFHTVMYFIMVSPLHVISIVFYAALIRLSKQTLAVCVALGISISLIVYLTYAYKYSVDWSLEYFPVRIAWYFFLGGFFGWMYFKYAKQKMLELKI